MTSPSNPTLAPGETPNLANSKGFEGMALARPIVASAVGGIPEMLVDGESGLLVPPDDAGALAAAVVTLLRDETRRQALGAAAYARLETEFTLRGFARAMFDAFDTAVADGVP